MIKINKKNAKIILTVVILIIIGIGYYIYINEIDFSINKEEILGNTENKNKELEDAKENIIEDNNKNIIIVHISGAVQKEGIIEIEEESRVCDVIEKAGGLNKNACIKDINLASKVEDGEKIYVPTEDEYTELENKNQDNKLKKISSQKSSISKNNKININTATQSELEKLPGIGSATALKIITYRNENGRFKTIEDIKKVKGIGESKFKEIKDLIVI